MSSKSRGWLVKNAVMAWLVNYAEKEAGELTEDYRALYEILDKEYEPQFDEEDEQPTTTETRKRGRPAKRARTKKASSDPPSTEENETTNQET
mgnify:FL=1|tara:strand:+ start:162 stop:440 length:279 start_codon:yes stop_codon:yes gene_type:complete